MAEPQFKISENGREIQKDDLTLLSQSAVMDDRILAELFRLIPYDGVTVTKSVIPYSTNSSAQDGVTGQGNSGLVIQGNPGSVRILPFRAIIGSRTPLGTSALASYRDVRSTILIGAAFETTVSIGANASGNPRWDLIYAAVTPDADAATVVRYVKNPTTSVIAAQNVVTQISTNTGIGIVQGTPAVNPSLPAIPADAGGSYYIPLAYIRVRNGAGAGTSYTHSDFFTAAPVFPMDRVTGISSVRVASEQNRPSGTALTPTRIGVWGSLTASDSRPTFFLPPDMTGAETIWVALDLKDAAVTANWSHQNGTVIDNTRDWRNRVFQTHLTGGGTTFEFGWMRRNSGVSLQVPTHLNSQLITIGQSFVNDATGTFNIVEANPAVLTFMQAATGISIYADGTTGALKLAVVGFPRCLIFAKIEASAPFHNA